MLTGSTPAIFSLSTQAIGRWINRPSRRKPTLGELLAAESNSPPRHPPTDVPQSNILRHLLPTESIMTIDPKQSTQTIQTHLYLALGSLGLSSVALLAVPVLNVVTFPVQVYFVARFLRGGIGQVVWKRQVGMAVIDALVTGALLGLGYFWAISLYASFFYWSRSMLLRTSNRYQDDMLFLTSTPPRQVRVLRTTGETWVGLDTLDLEDTIVVYAGEVVPVDGLVVGGLAQLDQRVLTGEAQPVERETGQHVFALTLVLSGMLQIRARQTGTSTVAAQINSLLQDMHSYTAALNLQAEQIGNRYALPMLLLSGGTLLLLGPISALTVLCAYIGYSLRITDPLSVLNYLQLATQHQILLKDGQALRTLHTVDTVIFDKTGTLTQEQPQVVNIYAYAGYAEEEVLTLAATAEQHQTHPIARALLQAADERYLTLRTSTDARYEPGVGVTINVDGSIVRVVSVRFLEREGIELPLCAETVQSYCYQRGHSLVYVVLGDTVIGAIELAAQVRPEAQSLVEQLQNLGKTVTIVSGDHEQPTRRLAQTLHTDTYYAEMLPSDKASLIARLQGEGKTVCFVGDGINDALALKQANVAVSLHGAAGLALDTAQIILPDADLAHMLTLFTLADHLHDSMRGNLVCSIVPGVITIAGVYLFNFGIVAAYVLYYTGFAAGITNAMLPLVLPYKLDEQQQ